MPVSAGQPKQRSIKKHGIPLTRRFSHETVALVIPFVKDAAKAVKRICQEEFKEVLDETLTELLGIATLVVKMYALRREGEDEVLHLWCVHREEIAVCTVGSQNRLSEKARYFSE